MIGLWRTSDKRGRWVAVVMWVIGFLDLAVGFHYLSTGHYSLSIMQVGLTLLMVFLGALNLHSGMMRRTREEIERELARRANWWMN